MFNSKKGDVIAATLLIIILLVGGGMYAVHYYGEVIRK